MDFGRDPSPPNQFRYTFEDQLDEEMTSADHASQISKMEFGRNPRPPNQFRYPFEDKIDKEMTKRCQTRQLWASVNSLDSRTFKFADLKSSKCFGPRSGECTARGQPSSWLPRGELVEQSLHQKNSCRWKFGMITVLVNFM